MRLFSSFTLFRRKYCANIHFFEGNSAKKEFIYISKRLAGYFEVPMQRLAISQMPMAKCEALRAS
jgi:hypothetical protein